MTSTHNWHDNHTLARQLKHIFRSFDTDKRSTISKEKLIKVLRSLDKSFTDDELECLFEKADKNRDGVIQYKEFVNFVCFLEGKQCEIQTDLGVSCLSDLQFVSQASMEEGSSLPGEGLSLPVEKRRVTFMSPTGSGDTPGYNNGMLGAATPATRKSGPTFKMDFMTPKRSSAMTPMSRVFHESPEPPSMPSKRMFCNTVDTMLPARAETPGAETPGYMVSNRLGFGI